MPDWLFLIINLLSILAGIVLTHSLIIYSRFHSESAGYMWRAVRKIWLFLFVFVIIEWIIASFFFLLISVPVGFTFFPLSILAAIVGILAAFAPTSLENIVLPQEGVSVKKLKKPLTKLLLTLHLTLRHEFAWAITSRRQQDVFDSQHSTNDWDFRIPKKDIERKLRMLYEQYKYDIAEDRDDPTLSRYDVDHYPWEKFYLLARHLGRERLRQCLRNPVDSPCPEWRGDERRRVSGSRLNRKNPRDRNSRCQRRYDLIQS